jgi:hypothetical protein
MTKDNALSFVGQIVTEHKAVLKADGEALIDHANLPHAAELLWSRG